MLLIVAALCTAPVSYTHLYLISLYKNREKNPHNAQLVFTAHNTAILTPGAVSYTHLDVYKRQVYSGYPAAESVLLP